jgi:hypothetical protein
MAQIGLNAGPRHCRVSGFAKSFSKKLDKDTMIERDLDAIAAVSIFWSLVRALMPSEVVSHVEECLKHEGLPRLATRNVEEGHILIICSHHCADHGNFRNWFPAVPWRQNL